MATEKCIVCKQNKRFNEFDRCLHCLQKLSFDKEIYYQSKNKKLLPDELNEDELAFQSEIYRITRGEIGSKK